MVKFILGLKSHFCGKRSEVGQSDGVLQAIDIVPEVFAPILLELQKEIYSGMVDHQHYSGLHWRVFILHADGT